jgi:methanogenic corrinoid protein MtbC1
MAPLPRFEELERLRDGIVRGAVAIDGVAIDRALDEAFSRVSPELVLANVIEPAAKEIGLLWSRGRCSVAGEHLASNLFLRRLQNLVGSGGKAPPDSPLVLSACFEGELHALGALVVAFHLSKAGMRVAYLGPDLPIEDLEASVSVLAPRVVILSVAREEAFFKGFARFLGFAARQRDRVLVYLGGRGVPDDTTTLTAAGVRIWPATRPVSELPMALTAELNRAPSSIVRFPTASPAPPAYPGPSSSLPQPPRIERPEPRQAAKAGISRRRRRS